MPEAPAKPGIDLSILEDLDFDPEIDCEHSNHGKVAWHAGPAAHLIGPKGPCGKCQRVCKSMALCALAWAHWGRNGVRCPGCNTTRPRDELVKIIGSVK
jgi:hypothetical protein